MYQQIEGPVSERCAYLKKNNIFFHKVINNKYKRALTIDFPPKQLVSLGDHIKTKGESWCMVDSFKQVTNENQ